MGTAEALVLDTNIIPEYGTDQMRTDAFVEKVQDEHGSLASFLVAAETQPAATPSSEGLELGPVATTMVNIVDGAKSVREAFRPTKRRLAALGASLLTLFGAGSQITAASAENADGDHVNIPTFKYHYMKFNGPEYKRTVRSLANCPRHLTVSSTHHSQTKSPLGKLTFDTLTVGENRYARVTLKKKQGATRCGAIALTGDGKYAFKPRFNAHGVFIDPNAGGTTTKVAEEVAVYFD